MQSFNETKSYKGNNENNHSNNKQTDKLKMLNSIMTLMTLGTISTLGIAISLEAEPLPNLYANRNDITVSGHSVGGQFACHLMWTASDTWSGAACSKGSGFDISVSEFDSLTDERIK